MNKTYQPLHHKYRPERFDDLVGQEVITATLKQALLTNKVAPAYLFSGPRGTGKTSSARILARSLNCLDSNSPTPEPCGVCELCKSISNGSSLDVIEIDAASNTGVENIRELIERSRFAPVQARWKVYVIDECHMLSTAAFNALLKTLEEPPPRVVFVLATTDPQRVLPTILSRCQRFDFRRIPIEALINHLEMIASKEAIDIDMQALHLIAQRAQGGLRDAESMLDQLSLLPKPIKASYVWDLLGVIPDQELLVMISALVNGDPVNLLETTRKILDQGREPLMVLQGLASILRDLVLTNAAPNRPELSSVSSELHSDLASIANQLKLETLLRWQASLKGAETELRQSFQPRLWLEVLLLGLLAKPNIYSKEKINESTTQLNNNLVSGEKKDTNLESENKNLIQEKSIPVGDINTKNNQEDIPAKHEPENNKDLTDLWNQILHRLQLPSTRMLLSQQAKLIRLSSNKAVVEVAENWMGMVQSRKSLLEQAINETLGGPKELIIESPGMASIEAIGKTVQNVPKTTQEAQHNKSLPTDTLLINPNKTKESLVKKEISIQEDKDSKKNESIENIDNKAKQLADFFNGKVLDIDI